MMAAQMVGTLETTTGQLDSALQAAVVRIGNVESSVANQGMDIATLQGDFTNYTTTNDQWKSTTTSDIGNVNTNLDTL